MHKQAPAKLSTKTATRYSRISTPSTPAKGKVTGVKRKAAAKTVMPSRIQVLQTQVVEGNPYDIGTEATLAALRRSGVLTAKGKLGKTFR